MRAGGGKQKGAQYERDVCVALSLWISGGKKRDLFWRSAMSGGRATVAGRKGHNLAAQAGDISATDKDGHALTDHYYVECKRYADLNFGAFLTKGIGPLAKFWTTAVEEATRYDRIPMLIVREDRNDTILMVPNAAMLSRGMTGHSFQLNPGAFIARMEKVKADLYRFDDVMLTPYQVPAKFKISEGPMLQPGELSRILRDDKYAMERIPDADLKVIKSGKSSLSNLEWLPARTELRTLGLPARACAILTGAGIEYLDELQKKSDADLLRLPNFGRKMLADVRDVLAIHRTPQPRPMTRRNGR